MASDSLHSFLAPQRTVLGRLFAALLIALATIDARAATAAVKVPFFMFTTSQFATADEAAKVSAVLRRHATSDDYLGINVVMQFPDLASRMSNAHLYTLPPSLAEVERAAMGKCGAGAGLIIYDGEHWSATPPNEQADMVTAIARGNTIVHQTGCQDYGIAPDGQYIGIAPGTCRHDLAASIHRGIDWTGITLFDIQAQRLLGSNCTKRAGVDTYIGAVRSIAADVRARSSIPNIVAQLSFRLTPPDRMIPAIRQLSGIADGFYIAYPRNVGTACSYCSPANLDQVLQAIHHQ